MKCFACDRAMKGAGYIVITGDGAQSVHVGPDCFARVHAAGTDGWQPPLGGPRLFLATLKKATGES